VVNPDQKVVVTRMVQKTPLLDRISDHGPSLLDQMMDQPNTRSMSMPLYGLSEMESICCPFCCLSSKPKQYSKTSCEIPSLLKLHGLTQLNFPDSLIQSGQTLSQGVLLTSTMSLPVNT
jgi:hypothetical protein